MKHSIPVLLLSSLLATAAYGKPHASGLGFSIDIPAGWLILSQAEAKQHPGLFDPSRPEFAGMGKDGVASLKAQVEGGAMERYLHTGVGSSGFTDFITVIKDQGQVPVSDTDVKNSCGDLADELTAEGLDTGKAPQLYQCSAIKVAGRDALFFVEDGSDPDTKVIEYQIQQSAGQILILGGTFAAPVFDQERAGFDAMVDSIKLP